MGSDVSDVKARVSRIRRAWGLLLLALALLSLGLRGYLLKQVQDTVLTVWQILWLTVPLTAAVAILAYLAFARKAISVLTVVGVVVGTLVASLFVGLSSGGRVADELFPSDAGCALRQTCGQQTGGDSAPELAIRIIGAYLKVYGVTGFLSAIAVGTFLGYAFSVLSGRSKTAG